MENRLIAARQMAAGPKLAAELAETRKQLADAQQAATDAAESLADLSHEMKTPLTAVIGFSEAMKKESFGPLGNPRYLEYSGHIETAGNHLLDLVSTILDLSRIGAGARELRRIAINPADLASQSIEMVRPAAEKAGLSLRLDAPETMPDAWLDPQAVRQVLVNLLANAVKFTSDGVISLKARRIDDKIIFTIVDTGIGMSKADLDRLGARYTLAHAKGVRGAGGAGLGLSLAHQLASLHDGDLSLQSAPGEGLTATVTLPIGAHFIKKSPASRRRDGGVLTQLDRIDAYRRERAGEENSGVVGNDAVAASSF